MTGLDVDQLVIIYQLTKITSNTSIFTAEVTAIDLTLDAIAQSEDDHFIIFFIHSQYFYAFTLRKWIIL